MTETLTRRRSKKQMQFAQNMQDVDSLLSKDQQGLARSIVEIGTEMWGETMFGEWLARENGRLNAAPIEVIKQGQQGEQQVATMLVGLKTRKDVSMN